MMLMERTDMWRKLLVVKLAIAMIATEGLIMLGAYLYHGVKYGF